jgi:hypothetical protein
MLSKTVGTTLEMKSVRSNGGASTNRRRLRTCLSASVFALACISVAGPAFAQSAYDGGWSVVIMTRAGACESGIRYGVQIVGGQVVSAAGGGAEVRGRVSPSGAVAVSVQAGGQWASGSGHLNRAGGGGVWHGQGNAGTCSGTWVAQRSGYAPRAEGPQGPIYNYAPRYYYRPRPDGQW